MLNKQNLIHKILYSTYKSMNTQSMHHQVHKKITIGVKTQLNSKLGVERSFLLTEFLTLFAQCLNLPIFSLLLCVLFGQCVCNTILFHFAYVCYLLIGMVL